MLPPGNRRRAFHWEKYRRSAGDSCIANEPPENAQWNTPWVTTFRTDRWQLFTLWTCRQLDVELSCVARYKRPFSLNLGVLHFRSCSTVSAMKAGDFRCIAKCRVGDNRRSILGDFCKNKKSIKLVTLCVQAYWTFLASVDYTVNASLLRLHFCLSVRL